MSKEQDHTFDDRDNIDGESMRPTILLYPSGVYFEPYDPNPEHLDIRCLAHGLAGTNRFNGHTDELMNVAHHSVIVSLRIEAVESVAIRARERDAAFREGEKLTKERADAPLKGLLHDSPESVSGFGDIAGPMKRHRRIREIVEAVEGAILDAVGVKYGLSRGFASEPIVKTADVWSYHWENRDLRGINPPEGVVLPCEKLVPLNRDQARSAFLCRYTALTGEEIGDVPWSSDTGFWGAYLAEMLTIVNVKRGKGNVSFA